MILDYRSTDADRYIDAVRAHNDGKELKAAVITFGCQQNEADSERIRGLALLMGYTITDDPENADLIVINTCAIRAHAEMKALSMLGRFKAQKKKNPELIIGIAGCMAAESHVAQMLKTDFHYVSFTVEPSLLYMIPELVFKYLSSRKRSFVFGKDEGNIVEGPKAVRMSEHRAWVSVMYGCNNFCSYCIVPYVRGRERSRASNDIICECKELVSKGYKEITLLGQNVNSYKSDIGFPELLDRIASVDGDFIVRFMTSHPKDCSDELIKVMAKNAPKIAPYFHLPMQSGSTNILRKMNRRYTKDRFLELAFALKERVPGIALSTDVIVGFPGETDADFDDTLDVLSRVRFDLVYSFIYSPRVGTPAASMEDQVPREISDKRMARLLALQDEISLERSKAYVGTVQRVLVDSIEERDGEMLANGRTESNKLVHFPASDIEIGCFVKVKITAAGPFDLFAEIERG